MSRIKDIAASGRYHNSLQPKYLRAGLREAIATIRLHADPFDAIVVIGVSGLIFGAPLAYRMNKNLIVVRKPDDTKNHSWRIVEGMPVSVSFNYVFVDDCVDSGRTLQHALHHVGDSGRGHCVGAYLYRDTTRSEGVWWNEAKVKACLYDLKLRGV